MPLTKITSKKEQGHISKKTILYAANIAKEVLGYSLEAEMEIRIGEGFITMHGCPIDNDLKDVPIGEIRPDRKSWISELVLLGVTYSVGFSPFSFRQEKSGRLVHEITPILGKEKSISSNGQVNFKPHADGAFLSRENRPETLSLLCLNNDSETNTKIVGIDSLLSEFNHDEINILASAEFLHIPPETFELSTKTYSEKSSILDRITGVWEVKVATHNSQPKTERAKAVFEKFTILSEEKSHSIRWNPGDLVIFSNFRCLHGRGDINGKRWLQRCYGSSRVHPGYIMDLL